MMNVYFPPLPEVAVLSHTDGDKILSVTTGESHEVNGSTVSFSPTEVTYSLSTDTRLTYIWNATEGSRQTVEIT